ncbi:MAG TPA: hypothetical protein VL853_06740 [Gemmatimonadales bacterium]|nr:hypothetical protein [Gemmatimonadales bacterium]
MRSAFPPFRLPALIVLSILTACPPSRLSAQSRDWSPKDRTILGDFTRINAVASSIDRVYAAAPTALLIYDPQFKQWHGPFTPRDPGTLDRVFAGLADPLDNSLWLARPDGWVHYSPELDLWERGIAPNTVQEIAFDADQPALGLLLRTTSGWFNVPRGGVSAVPINPPRHLVRPATANDAIRSNPALQANSSAILLNGRLRTARYTSAAKALGLPGWYLGTTGVGLLFLPEGAAIPERLSFGLPGEDVGALFPAPGGVWIVTQRTPNQDAAISFVSNELTQFRWIEGPRATGFPFNKAHRLVGNQKDLWAATDVGLMRLNPESEEMDLYDEGAGLPNRTVTDLAVRRGRIAVATLNGVVSLGDSLKIQPVAPSFTDAALAVAFEGDTIWVGTEAGLAVALPGQGNLMQPIGLKQSPAFQAPVVDIEWASDTLVALTTERMLWRDTRSDTWTLGPVLSAQVGRLHTFVRYHAGFFVAGERGFGYAALNTQIVRPIVTPGDLPGPVTSIAVDEGYLWVGTRRGLVRFSLDAIGP